MSATHVGVNADLATVQEKLDRSTLIVEPHNDQPGALFVGHWFGRATGPAAGTAVRDISWPVRATMDAADAALDADPTYKLITVIGLARSRSES